MSVTEELHSSLFNFQRNSQMKERKNCTISLIVKYYLLSRKNGQEDLRHDIYSTRQYTRTHIDQYDAEFHPASLEDEFDIRSF